MGKVRKTKIFWCSTKIQYILKQFNIVLEVCPYSIVNLDDINLNGKVATKNLVYSAVGNLLFGKNIEYGLFSRNIHTICMYILNSFNNFC